jgi:hypothetical protein
MLTAFDDYPIHQTPEPLAHPGSGDRNVYDRYFFNGFSRAGDLFFGVAMGLYPNRQVMDASVSVLRRGTQTAVHASRRAPLERADTRVGPIGVEVLEPLRVLRVRVDDNAHGVAGELVFRARTAAIEEPRFTFRVGPRVIMDSTRLTQFGTWDGWLAVDGERVPIAPAEVLGVRDRSWGVRPVGEPEPGAPGLPPQFFWLWSPVHFDDVCTLFDSNEDADGRPWHRAGTIARAEVDGTLESMATVAHRVRWEPGTRRARAAEITLAPHGDAPLTLGLEPILTFQMRGLGYLHPEWGHGMWKGEEAVGGERWRAADIDPLEPRHLHVQQLCRARLGVRQGLGVLEQLVLGPHAPSGFTGILDGAPEV